MDLVILAAGHARRFGGLKQLAAVGPEGEAIMDYTARSAARSGFDRVILVVRPEIRDQVLSHVAAHFPRELTILAVCQAGVPGTVQAVVDAGQYLTGAFGVVNGDDLYGDEAIEGLAALVGSRASGLVGYRLAATVLGDEPVTRGICSVGEDGLLVGIDERRVTRLPSGAGVARTAPPGTTDAPVPASTASGRAAPSPHASVLFESAPIAGISATREQPGSDHRQSGHPESAELGVDGEDREPVRAVALLRGDAIVSMNLWAFQPSVLDHLRASLAHFDHEAHSTGRVTPEPELAPAELRPRELILPQVVGRLVSEGVERFQVSVTENRCIGITHPDDLARVRAEIAAQLR